MKAAARLGQWCVEKLGADYTQWRVLTRVMLKTDFRSASALQMGNSPAREGAGTQWMSLLLYGAFGLYGVAVAVVLPDLFLAAVWSLSMMGLVVAMVILIDYGSVVISPTDYEILAHQPVSSRTYFLVKLTNVLLYAGMIGALVTGPTWIFLGVRHGLITAVVFPVIAAAAITWTALAIVSVYAWLVRVVRPARFDRILSYIQVLLVTAVVAAPLLLGELEDRLEAVEIGTSPALFALPAAWFASALPLVNGEWSVTGVLAVLTAAGSTVCLFYIVSRRLSLSYAERMGALLTASASDRSRVSPMRSARRRFPVEVRAVATLLRGHFRHDRNFRMAVLSILPMTLLYVYLSLREGSLPDPFVNLGFEASRLWTIHFVVIGGPQMLLESLFRSESFRAGWIFFASPVDRAKLVTGAGHCIALFVLLPYLTILGGVFVWAFGDVLHAGAHAVVLGLVSNLAVQVRLLLAPRLPFSEPPAKGGFSVGVFSAMVVSGVLIGLLPLALGAAYAGTAATIATIVVLVLANAAAPRLVARRIAPRLQRLEFAG
ncbi:MAG: hypothetical protein OXI39_03430 [Gemmatimonadota bacterium]|uniref:hypothetical protein n=1 Tax=Candidatus Palauibacter scopulicola TaxID=3056741 RepID=UPI002393ECC1|nr:hypothetical protein [Candidatus Palauibacter scopulicola]MDE2662043.1 hypothetical protein [Candidatus Palauibacter scopulicola]